MTTFNASSTERFRYGHDQEYRLCRVNNKDGTLPRAMPMTTPSPNRGVMIVLAYLWPLALVPLLVEKDDAEVQWHAKHGIVLMVAEIVAAARVRHGHEHRQPGDVRPRLRARRCSSSSCGSASWRFTSPRSSAASTAAVLIIPGVSEYANRF